MKKINKYIGICFIIAGGMIIATLPYMIYNFQETIAACANRNQQLEKELNGNINLSPKLVYLAREAAADRLDLWKHHADLSYSFMLISGTLVVLVGILTIKTEKTRKGQPVDSPNGETAVRISGGELCVGGGKITFRIIILSQVVIGLADMLSKKALFKSLPEPFLNAWCEKGSWGLLSWLYEKHTPTWVLIVFGLSIVVILIFSLTGMFFFWRPGRLCYILTFPVMSIFMMSLISIGGVYLAHPLTVLFDYIGALLTGMLIALAYSSPINNEFQKTPQRISSTDGHR